ncbi:flagellar basal body rod protein FlgB [Halotalea alkalilenta]|uniref:Flagellar basal body rod protein FlgB n=1 Tax=Halotalea alkalilenta TaxID=376489 RepID=A0A172YGY2_9GAMM|nr:flagellar basal body rod protein FlgB [Halotalea alkalilenta]ANF58376.1 flagellar biosynthesis protein FlgB [Halotalea alkalilenta]
MIDRLNESFSFLQGALDLRSRRQEVLSANIANADTPHYKARDFDFKQALDSAMSQAGARSLSLQLTSSAHIPASSSVGAELDLAYRIPAQPSLDGNTVDMDLERLNFADNSQHIESTLGLLNSKIRGLNTVMQAE